MHGITQSPLLPRAVGFGRGRTDRRLEGGGEHGQRSTALASSPLLPGSSSVQALLQVCFLEEGLPSLLLSAALSNESCLLSPSDLGVVMVLAIASAWIPQHLYLVLLTLPALLNPVIPLNSP